MFGPRLRSILREEGARGALIAFVSTLAFVVVVWRVVVSSAAWPKVQAQFFDFEQFSASFPDVLRGFWLDVRLFMIGQVAILVFALVLAMVRSLAASMSSCTTPTS